MDELQAKLSDLEEEALYEIAVYPQNGAGLGQRCLNFYVINSRILYLKLIEC